MGRIPFLDGIFVGLLKSVETYRFEPGFDGLQKGLVIAFRGCHTAFLAADGFHYRLASLKRLYSELCKRLHAMRDGFGRASVTFEPCAIL
jgi:hypothetical protein